MILATWFCLRKCSSLYLDKSWPTAVWLTAYCFRLFPEITVLKKLIERSLEKTTKPDSRQGGSEAPGSHVLHFAQLVLCQSSDWRRTGAAAGVQLIWCKSNTSSMCCVCASSTCLCAWRWIYHSRIWLMLFMNRRKHKRSWAGSQRKILVICQESRSSSNSRFVPPNMVAHERWDSV